MRIGTWNLAGRWSPHHHDLMQQQDCDVWLLTEVSTKVFLAGHKAHLAVQEMAPKRRWAGVFSRIGLTALPDPHPASATAIVDSTTFCSSILPWRRCGHRAPWVVIDTLTRLSTQSRNWSPSYRGERSYGAATGITRCQAMNSPGASAGEPTYCERCSTVNCRRRPRIYRTE
jgi:hypothetical protein